MAIHRPLILLTFVTFILGVQGHKYFNGLVPCIENNKFYRNPNRDEQSLWAATECSKYYLCLGREVFEFQCSGTMYFDVQRQICDEMYNVHNCEVTLADSDREMFPSDIKTCDNTTHLNCRNGNCILRAYFCDGSKDCSDGSDEADCSSNTDPNAAKPCDPSLCVSPQCFCSPSGTDIPNHIPPSETPQMIMLTFGGTINHENWDILSNQLFTSERRNPNSCPIKGTFFVSHPYTNYRHVQKLWNDGHEIGVNSVTTRGPANWWTNEATVEDWFDEMVGQANIISRFANVRMEDFRGLRVPYLSTGWNRQYIMMHEFGFVYDSSLIAPYSEVPYWPYTLDYQIPHNCTVSNQRCPTRSYAGLWQMVINPLKYENMICQTIKRCPFQVTPNDLYQILANNFKRHYTTNRAPYGLHFSSRWLKNPDYLAVLKKFIDQSLMLNDVYYVTQRQVIDWIRFPTPLRSIESFTPWKCKPKTLEQCEIACSKPNTCKLSGKGLDQDRYMITCTDCPKRYPWIRNEFGLD